MTRWHVTASLARALVAAGAGFALAVALGKPALVVLVGPLAVCGAIGVWHRPRSEPAVRASLGHHVLHEGQGTTSGLELDRVEAAEQVTRAAARAPYLTFRPARGTVAGLLTSGGGGPEIEVSPRRWGRHSLGEERVALTSRWAGFRWGPVDVDGHATDVLPVGAPFDSRAEAPLPDGLVGAYRSRRPASGTEFAAIRMFAAGDRVRRVHWRVSLRTGDLHVVDGLAEEDTAVLVVLDALADVGRSGGVDGAASSLDLSVRAAAAIVEHYLRRGDRVALRVVGGSSAYVGYGSGVRHLRRLQGTLAQVRAGEPHELAARALQLGAEAGAVAMIASPMLHETILAVVGRLAGAGLPVLVVDTLPQEVAEDTEAAAPEVSAQAWRMRRIERDELLVRLAGTGCPIVPWRGPGTVDDVMRRLARSARLPRVSSR